MSEDRLTLNEDGIALGSALWQANDHLRSLLFDPEAGLADIANACVLAARRYDEFAKHVEGNDE